MKHNRKIILTFGEIAKREQYDCTTTITSTVRSRYVREEDYLFVEEARKKCMEWAKEEQTRAENSEKRCSELERERDIFEGGAQAQKTLCEFAEKERDTARLMEKQAEAQRDEAMKERRERNYKGYWSYALCQQKIKNAIEMERQNIIKMLQGKFEMGWTFQFQNGFNRAISEIKLRDVEKPEGIEILNDWQKARIQITPKRKRRLLPF